MCEFGTALISGSFNSRIQRSTGRSVDWPGRCGLLQRVLRLAVNGSHGRKEDWVYLSEAVEHALHAEIRRTRVQTRQSGLAASTQ